MIKIIYDGVEATTRKSQVRFQIIRVLDLNNLKTCLRFPCLGLNPIIDYWNLYHNSRPKAMLPWGIRRGRSCIRHYQTLPAIHIFPKQPVYKLRDCKNYFSLVFGTDKMVKYAASTLFRILICNIIWRYFCHTLGVVCSAAYCQRAV